MAVRQARASAAAFRRGGRSGPQTRHDKQKSLQSKTQKRVGVSVQISGVSRGVLLDNFLSPDLTHLTYLTYLTSVAALPRRASPRLAAAHVRKLRGFSPARLA